MPYNVECYISNFTGSSLQDLFQNVYKTPLFSQVIIYLNKSWTAITTWTAIHNKYKWLKNELHGQNISMRTQKIEQTLIYIYIVALPLQ